MIATGTVIPLRLLVADWLDGDTLPFDALMPADGRSWLDEIGVEDYDMSEVNGTPRLSVTLVFLDELLLDMPGLSGLQLVLGGDGEHTRLHVEVDLEPPFEVRLIDVTLMLRFSREVLRPVKAMPDGGFAVDPEAPPRQVGLSATLSVDLDGNLAFDADNAFTLEPAMIGESGVVVEGTVAFDLSQKRLIPQAQALDLPTSWRGAVFETVVVHLPRDLDVPIAPDSLALRDFAIGSGGVSGTIEGSWDAIWDADAGSHTGDGAGTLGGIPFGLHGLSLEFTQNVPTASSIDGEIVLPFFEHPVAVEVGLGFDGSLDVALSAAQAPGVDAAAGLVTFERDDLFRVTVESLGFTAEQDGFAVQLSGELSPLAAGLDWPTFTVRELAIDSEGNVRLEGGWQDLPDQYVLDFHGYRLEITRLGFGTNDDGGRWIGFSGGVKLVDGLQAGASVEGLRITWYEDGQPSVTFNGVGVEFEVPEVLRFKGAVSYSSEAGHRFAGAIRLELVNPEMAIDGVLVIGSTQQNGGRHNYFGLYLDGQFPAGIPLWTTGLGLYGMAGLFALQMEPDRQEHEAWYEDWYQRHPAGVTQLDQKWTDEPGSLAVGTGVTIGTLPDNGYSFSAKMLFVIIFPGPILMLEGRANLLRERAQLTEEPVFRALAVLDARAGHFVAGLDAQYRYGEGGQLIDISGGAEAFFSFTDPEDWYLHLGEKEPREERIRAQIFRLFEANAYLMLDSDRLALGASVGYDERWTFGPLRVELAAWMYGNAVMSWKPLHFHGDLRLHGQAGLSAYGVGLSLTAEAFLAADVFEPFRIRGGFSVDLSLPWPLPDPKAEICLEWGPTLVPPPVTLPLKDVAVEHLHVTTTWPLPRGLWLRPDYEDPDLPGFRTKGDPGGDPEKAAPPADVPVVPLDARPMLTFARPVHDGPGVGGNPQPVTPEWERIGDPQKDQGPMRARYSLERLALERWNGSDWQPVADTEDDSDAETLYGMWVPMPAAPDGDGKLTAQVKLMLWARTPFEYTRRTGAEWDEWFTDRFDRYPCVDITPPQDVCCGFADKAPGDTLSSPWQCPDHPELTLRWETPAKLSIHPVDPPAAGFAHGLCHPGFTAGPAGDPQLRPLTLELAEPASTARVTVAPRDPVAHRCVDFRHRGRGDNPRHTESFRFISYDGPEEVSQQTLVLEWEGLRGLQCRQPLVIDLPEPALRVALALTRFCYPATVEAFAADGSSAATATMTNEVAETETVVLTCSGITRVEITDPHYATLLHKVCYTPADGEPVPVWAMAEDSLGRHLGPFPARNGVIEVSAEHLTALHLMGQRPFCVLEVCATLGMSAEEVQLRQEMAEHLEEAVAHWYHRGEVLEPHTDYRLRMVTRVETKGEGELADEAAFSQDLTQVEFAYFRTGGPPGLGRYATPHEHPSPDEFESGLDVLTPYVTQTVPVTVPDPGEKPPLPRPVYRAYDVEVAFNTDYVEMLYRMARRNLGLYLYDANDQPVRDARGGLLVSAPRWEDAEELELSLGEERWATLLNERGCGSIDEEMIPRQQKLTASGATVVLGPDSLYEARLVPLLLHDDFGEHAGGDAHASGPSDPPGSGGTIGRWQVYDEAGTSSGPSVWQVEWAGDPESPRLILAAAVQPAGADPAAPPAPAGTLLAYGSDPALPAGDPEQPTQWADYRLSVYVRFASGGSLGAAVRYQGPGSHYRLVLDCDQQKRRLVRVDGGGATVLAEDDFAFDADRDYLVAIEAAGSRLRVFQEGAHVFDVEEEPDEALPTGGVALYGSGAPDARFTDVRVDDLRAAAPVVYRFSFITSHFATFHHHLHSFQDEVWPLEVPADADVAAAEDAAPPADAMPDDDEHRAYASLAEALLGSEAYRNPERVEVSRLHAGEGKEPLLDGEGGGAAFLIRSPEPLDWSRLELEVTQSSATHPEPSVPGGVKLVEARWNGDPGSQQVMLLLREATEVTGYGLEYRELSSEGEEGGEEPERPWQALYAFGNENPLPAGFRIQVHAGEPGEEGVGPGVERRVAGGEGNDGEDGAPSLPQEGFEVRVLDARGVVVHRRAFLPDDAYRQAGEVRLLRRADGTGFFLFVEPGESVESGEGLGSAPAPTTYRLRFTFRKDNTAVDPQSPILRQGGNAGLEHITLDIP